MIKKIIALFATIILLSQTTLASDVDLKSMSTDDLIVLRTAIVQELMDRGDLKSATVPAGDYTVGTDIPSGSYSISTSQMLVTVTINDYAQMYVVSPEDGVGKVTLKDGDSFSCTSTIVLEKYAGLTFE